MKKQQTKHATTKQNKQQKQPINFISIKDQWKKPTKSKLTFIDLFSGCGGITKGFELAGLEPIAGFDFNRDAV